MNRPRLKFKENWLWKRIDYDGVYDFQCVDLAKLYLERLGFWNIWKLGNAKQVPQADLFTTGREKIVGTNDLMQGDIIIKTQGKYGHIAIVDRIVGGKVFVLEQNWSWKNSWSGTGDNAIRIQPYNLSFYDTILRCEKIFDNLVLEREFVAEKLKKLEGVAGQENEIRNTKEYLATTRYQVN